MRKQISPLVFRNRGGNPHVPVESQSRTTTHEPIEMKLPISIIALAFLTTAASRSSAYTITRRKTPLLQSIQAWVARQARTGAIFPERHWRGDLHFLSHYRIRPCPFAGQTVIGNATLTLYAEAPFGSAAPRTVFIDPRACYALWSCRAMPGQRPSHKPAQGNALGNPPRKPPSPERAEQGVPPFQGLGYFSSSTQGVALGWLVCAPLALDPASFQSA